VAGGQPNQWTERKCEVVALGVRHDRYDLGATR
jgi:hypothetical protein